MVTYEKIYEDEIIVRYRYYPNGQEEDYGIIQLEKVSGRIILKKKASCEIEDPWYGMFAVMNIQRLYKQGELPDKGMEFINFAQEEDD